MEVTCAALAGVSIMVKRKLHKPTRWFNYHIIVTFDSPDITGDLQYWILKLHVKKGKIVNFKPFCSLYFTGQHGLNTVGKWEKIKRLRNTNE